MPQPPNLLNEDGSASMATMLMLSHHAFRRDITRFLNAVTQIKAGDTSRIADLQQEWTQSLHAGLHGHHHVEDTAMFPDIKAKHPEAADAINTLTEQHHHIDPLLAKGDAVFADLAHPEHAEALLAELKALLDEHLTFEEANITPLLRNEKTFPAPPNDEAAAMYAGGFAWSMQGIAPSVLTEVQKMLPAAVAAALPAAQQAFHERCTRVWGTFRVGAATTPIPDGYTAQAQGRD